MISGLKEFNILKVSDLLQRSTFKSDWVELLLTQESYNPSDRDIPLNDFQVSH